MARKIAIMAVSSKFSDTSASTLWEMFNGNDQFHVPRFQRNYAWGKDEVEALWTDLIEGFQAFRKNSKVSKEAQYLLGSVVLVHNRDNIYWVIDGQQRLSTITMLFCVARDIILERWPLKDNREPQGYGDIMRMLENTNVMGKHDDWKLTLNDTDRDMFRQIQEYEDDLEPQIQRTKKMKAKTKSEKLLKENYIWLYNQMKSDFKLDEQITEKKYGQQSEYATLNYFLAHVRNNNFVVKIVVEESKTAYQIFETLNYRGRGLAKSDLIKNYVLNQVDQDEQRRMNETWNNIFNDIIRQGERDDVFILESIRSRRPDLDTSLRKLYDYVHGDIRSTEKAVRYVKNLRADAEFLTTLYNPKIYDDDKTRDEIYAMEALKAKSIRVPILVASRKWGMNCDYRDLVRLLVKFFFKKKVVQNIHAGKMEDIMLKLSAMIENGKSIEEIAASLRAVDDHEDFMHNFKKFMLDPSSNAAKYVLRQITMHLGNKNTGVKPIDNLTLEHILPKKKNWNQDSFFKGYHGSNKKIGDFVDYLGNLTLLNDAINSSIKNKTFSGKKYAYEESQLTINQYTVCNHREWTANIIEKRGELFAEYADKIWNLDPK